MIKYTRQDCIEALERVATELDKSPSIRDYNQHKLDSEPSGHTIHRLFDEWNKAKQQASKK
jgi:hypothetical protein